LLALVEQAPAVAAELAGAQPELHRAAEGHIPDHLEPAEVAALAGGQVLQQFAAEAAEAFLVRAFAQAGAEVAHEQGAPFPSKGLVGEACEGNRIEAERRRLGRSCPDSQRQGTEADATHRSSPAEIDRLSVQWVCG
jgi:hypothetical protein